MKIYTKTGDTGTTGLIGGTRVPKYHLRIEAYGTVDELNSWIGLIRDASYLADGMVQSSQFQQIIELLNEVQDRLFTLGSQLANDPDGANRMKLPGLFMGDVDLLEKHIDALDAELPALKAFVLPGGHMLVSQVHVARCVCRRAERLVVQLSETSLVDELIIQYLNRLSDYLFTLSRYVAKEVKANEIPWKPRV